MEIKRGPFKGKKIEFADQTQVTNLKEQVDKVLWMIAGYMGWEDLSYVFVSDLSTLGDYSLEDHELAEFGRKLGFEVGHKDYIYEIALRLKPAS